MSSILIGIGSIICVAWGGALLLFPTPIASFSRKVEGETWGRQATPELTRFIGCAFVLAGVIAVTTLTVALLKG